MGNLERSLAFAGLAMVAGACDDSARGSGSSDSGDIGIRDFGSTDATTPDDQALCDNPGPDNCLHNVDCRVEGQPAVTYCAVTVDQTGRRLKAVCEPNPSGPINGSDDGNGLLTDTADCAGVNTDCYGTDSIDMARGREYCHESFANGHAVWACLENPVTTVNCADAGSSARPDGAVLADAQPAHDARVPVDAGARPDAARTPDAGPLNEEFLCNDNRDCDPNEYCHVVSDELGAICRDNPHGTTDIVGNFCGGNDDCPPDQYCAVNDEHDDADFNGSECLQNPRGEIAGPDAGGSQPPRPDAAVIPGDGSIVNPQDGAVARLDGGGRADALLDLDGQPVANPDGSPRAEAGPTDAGRDATDGGDAEAGGPIGPLPTFDAAGAEVGVVADSALTDGPLADVPRSEAGVMTDGAVTDGPLADVPRSEAGVMTDGAVTDGPLADVPRSEAGIATDGAVTDGPLADVPRSEAGIATDGAVNSGSDAAEIPAEPCGGPCLEGELCNPVDNVCEEPSCTVKEDCVDPDDRCFVEGQGPGEGVCVSPDVELELEVGHEDGTIHVLSTTGLDRQSWNVPPVVPSWSGNLDTRDQGVALLVPATLEALTAHCGDMARCVLREVNNGLFSRVSREGVTFGPNETVALPGGANIMTVEDVRSAAAEDLVGACFFADQLCNQE